MRIFGWFVLSLVVIAALAFFSGGLDLALQNVFGVRQANVQRKIFEQSQSYNEGMIRDLEHLQAQYVNADESGKAALKALVIHRFEVYPEDQLSPELLRFYTKLRSGQ